MWKCPAAITSMWRSKIFRRYLSSLNSTRRRRKRRSDTTGEPARESSRVKSPLPHPAAYAARLADLLFVRRATFIEALQFLWNHGHLAVGPELIHQILPEVDFARHL